jgi:excinuclease ABC subunit C
LKAFDRKFGDDFVSALPTVPGVYRMLDESGTVVYVGKAKNLRRRISQYRNAKRRRRHRKMKSIVSDAHAIEIQTCATELEAVLLESRLIRELRPKWNVAGAFYFLYPMIGIKASASDVLFCYTTTPEVFPGFAFHGAYRSRSIAGDAFFALTRLLPYVLHPIPPARILGKDWRMKRPKYSYLFGFRAGANPSFATRSWEGFFRGTDHAPLEELSLALLEHADACRAADKIQEDLKCVQRFWRHEASPLGRALRATAHGSYPVAQTERDDLFLKYRFALRESRLRRQEALAP